MEQSLTDNEIAIFQKIVDIVTNAEFQRSQFEFFEKHANTFDVDDENKLEYTKIHNDFKNLVEELIGHLLAELGVTQEQFMEAC